MIKIAVYGKGGIGKSTTVSNVAAALAEKGLTVMQIGCDPKADSTIQLRHGKEMRTVLDLYNEKKQNLKLKDMTMVGYQGVICVEAGGPTPGLGCAGRGIITPGQRHHNHGAGLAGVHAGGVLLGRCASQCFRNEMPDGLRP